MMPNKVMSVGLLSALWLFVAPLHAGHPDPDYDLDAIVQEVHDLINAERAGENIAPLKWSNDLAGIAGSHSADQARNDYFSHEDRQGRGASERANRAGYSCSRPTGDGRTRVGLGENIFHTFMYAGITTQVLNGVETHEYEWKTETEIAREAVVAWMNSRGHRQNILTPHYQEAGIGIGVKKGENDWLVEIWITQTFC